MKRTRTLLNLVTCAVVLHGCSLMGDYGKYELSDESEVKTGDGGSSSPGGTGGRASDGGAGGDTAPGTGGNDQPSGGGPGGTSGGGLGGASGGTIEPPGSKYPPCEPTGDVFDVLTQAEAEENGGRSTLREAPVFLEPVDGGVYFGTYVGGTAGPTEVVGRLITDANEPQSLFRYDKGFGVTSLGGMRVEEEGWNDPHPELQFFGVSGGELYKWGFDLRQPMIVPAYAAPLGKSCNDPSNYLSLHTYAFDISEWLVDWAAVCVQSATECVNERCAGGIDEGSSCVKNADCSPSPVETDTFSLRYSFGSDDGLSIATSEPVPTSPLLGFAGQTWTRLFAWESSAVAHEDGFTGVVVSPAFTSGGESHIHSILATSGEADIFLWGSHRVIGSSDEDTYYAGLVDRQNLLAIATPGQLHPVLEEGTSGYSLEHPLHNKDVFALAGENEEHDANGFVLLNPIGTQISRVTDVYAPPAGTQVHHTRAIRTEFSDPIVLVVWLEWNTTSEAGVYRARRFRCD